MSRMFSFSFVLVLMSLIVTPAFADFKTSTTQQVYYNDAHMNFSLGSGPSYNDANGLPHGTSVFANFESNNSTVQVANFGFNANSRTGPGEPTGWVNFYFSGVETAPTALQMPTGLNISVAKPLYTVNANTMTEVYDLNAIGKGVVIAADTRTMPLPVDLWSHGSVFFSVDNMEIGGQGNATYDDYFDSYNHIMRFNATASMPVVITGSNPREIALELAAAYPVSNVPEPSMVSLFVGLCAPFLARRRRVAYAGC